jgi:hypothetical protein
MAISQETSAQSRAEIDEIFSSVSEALRAPGGGTRPYLVGERFTAADLTFAALAGPLLHVPQLDALQPPLERFPSELQATVAALRHTPAGAHALRIYEAYRFATVGLDGRVLAAPPAARSRHVAFRSGGARNNALALGAAAVALVGVPCAAALWGLRRRRDSQ